MTKIMINSHESLSTLVQAFTTNGESNFGCNRAWDDWPHRRYNTVYFTVHFRTRKRTELTGVFLILSAADCYQSRALCRNTERSSMSSETDYYWVRTADVTENDDPLTSWGTSILFYHLLHCYWINSVNSGNLMVQYLQKSLWSFYQGGCEVLF